MLETAAGLIRVTATCRDGRCERVTFDGVPSFVEALDVPLYVPGLGDIRVDVAYGGCYYVFADPAQFGVKLDREQRPPGRRCRHGDLAGRAPVDQRAASGDPRDRLHLLRDADRRRRSGQRLAARRDRAQRAGRPLAVRHRQLGAAGAAWPLAAQAEVGSRFIARSLIDSEFTVEMIGETTVGDRPAVLPRISGRGWVVGTRTSTVDPTDPYPLGYVLSDVWGDEVGSL